VQEEFQMRALPPRTENGKQDANTRANPIASTGFGAN